MLTRPRFIYFTIMWEVHKVQDYQKPSKNLLAWAWDGHMTHRGWLREAAQSFEMLKAGTAEGSRHRKSLWLDKQSNCIHVTAVDGLSIDLIGLEHTYKEIVIPEEYLPRKLKKKKKKRLCRKYPYLLLFSVLSSSGAIPSLQGQEKHFVPKHEVPSEPSCWVH